MCLLDVEDTLKEKYEECSQPPQPPQPPTCQERQEVEMKPAFELCVQKENAGERNQCLAEAREDYSGLLSTCRS